MSVQFGVVIVWNRPFSHDNHTRLSLGNGHLNPEISRSLASATAPSHQKMLKKLLKDVKILRNQTLVCKDLK